MNSYCPIARPSDWREPEPELEWRRVQKPRTDVQRKLLLIDEIVARAFINARTATVEHSLEQRFHEQAEKWGTETEHLSSPTQMMMHPSYQAILGMAREDEQKIIRLMLHDLRDRRRLWFWALSYLTKENPIKSTDAGKLDKMIMAWVEWGTQRGIL